MKKQRKARDPEHIGFKECFGTTTLSFTNALTGVLMSSMLMVYMTEYSGISYAALLATILLMAARVIDAVDDPIQGRRHCPVFASQLHGEYARADHRLGHCVLPRL